MLNYVNLYIKFALFNQRTKKKELLAAVLIKRCPSASGPAETNTGCGVVHQEYKSSPEQATVINLSNRITEAKNLCSTKYSVLI